MCSGASRDWGASLAGPEVRCETRREAWSGEVVAGLLGFGVPRGGPRAPRRGLRRRLACHRRTLSRRRLSRQWSHADRVRLRSCRSHRVGAGDGSRRSGAVRRKRDARDPGVGAGELAGARASRAGSVLTPLSSMRVWLAMEPVHMGKNALRMLMRSWRRFGPAWPTNPESTRRDPDQLLHQPLPYCGAYPAYVGYL